MSKEEDELRRKIAKREFFLKRFLEGRKNIPVHEAKRYLEIEDRVIYDVIHNNVDHGDEDFEKELKEWCKIIPEINELFKGLMHKFLEQTCCPLHALFTMVFHMIMLEVREIALRPDENSSDSTPTLQ